MTLITTNTSSNAASSSFTSSIDSTYKLYIFKFYDVNPATDEVIFQFQVNATDGADYNDSPIQSTYFKSKHTEADADEFGYHTSHDAANSTSFIDLIKELGNGGDEAMVGVFHLFNPSSTTYVKHWNCRTQQNSMEDASQEIHTAGYINDTTAIDDIQFKMSSGNMDAVIKMYGVG